VTDLHPPDGDTVLDSVDALDDQSTLARIAPLLEKTAFPGDDGDDVDEVLPGDGADAASQSLDDGVPADQGGEPA
jgi:hypothetical protein